MNYFSALPVCHPPAAGRPLRTRRSPAQPGRLWDGCEPPPSQVLCLWDCCARAVCSERGWPCLSQCHPPGLSPRPGSPAEPRQPPRCWRAACQCHPGGWLSPRADTARLPGSSRRTTTSSISDDKLLLQGAFVGTRCRAKEGGKIGLAGLRQTSKARASAPARSSPLPASSRGREVKRCSLEEVKSKAAFNL